MSVVANSFTKNTHAERALCAQVLQSTKASMVCCVPGGSSLLVGGVSSWETSSRGRCLLVGGLFSWERSPRARGGNAAKAAAFSSANERELRSQTASKPQCIPKPHAASRATRADQSVRQV